MAVSSVLPSVLPMMAQSGASIGKETTRQIIELGKSNVMGFQKKKYRYNKNGEITSEKTEGIQIQAWELALLGLLGITYYEASNLLKTLSQQNIVETSGLLTLNPIMWLIGHLFGGGK